MKIKFFRVITLILAFILMLNMFVACATSEERRKRRSSEIESDNSVKSAYELAVQNGFVGTMEEWLSSIIGNDKAQSDDKNTVETVKKYTVTFNWNCNDVSLVTKRITVKEGTILEMPTIPQRENATFLGWYTDVKCTKKFDFTTKITRSITLYAGWKLETYAEILEYQKAELEELKRLNNGELPEILLNEETYAPAFILGAYSDEKVNNFDSAIESLKDVENLMGFCNVEEEYVEISSFKFKDTVQYRMQQMHNGYVVYGQQLIVTTDENGGVTSLSGDYATIGYLFDPSINITVEEAIDVASEYSEFNSSEVTLVVYTLDGYNEMAYVLENEMYTVIVSAVDGMIIFECSEVMTELTVSEYDTVISTIGRNEEGDTFNTSYIDYADSTKQDNYVFYDKVRNIVYHDLEMAIEDDWGELVKKESLIDDDNIWTSNGSQKTIALSKNLSKTYDFYLEVLGLMSYDGNGGQSLAYVNDGSDSGKNAFNWGPDTFNGKIVTVLSFGGVANYQNNLDTVAHEYTHAVQNSLSSLKYFGQSGALMEAYSDVMGELVEAYYSENKKADWIHGERNMTNPSANNSSVLRTVFGFYDYPTQVYGAGYYNGNNDDGGVHHNSTVISHVIYAMYENGLNNIEELSELLYRTWGYLSYTATFYDYRISMLAAAEVMNLEDEKIDCINKAFDRANVILSTLPEDYDQGFFTSVKVDWHVIDSKTLDPIPGAHVTVQKIDENFTIVAQAYCDSNGNCSVTLKAGLYIVTETFGGYESNSTLMSFDSFTSVQITSKLKKTDYQLEAVKCMASGQITDALTNEPLDNVTMKFRKGYEVVSGREILSLTTNSDGKYSIENIDCGYYTVELSKDGYITSYVVVQVAAVWEDAKYDNVVSQNYSISPMLQQDGMLRIVLSWGEEPSDLDAHLFGSSTEGEEYHIYYNSKNAYDSNGIISELDIDDTDSFGPETVTVNLKQQGKNISYIIHDYSNSNDENSTALASSDAMIQVYSGNALIAKYSVPTAKAGTVWHVFDYDVSKGQIVVINKITNNFPE